MQLSTLLLLLTAMAIGAFVLGRRRSIAAVGGYNKLRSLHSLPKYYGYFAVLCCVLPGLLLIVFWLAFSDTLIMDRVVASLPAALRDLPADELSLVINDVKNLAGGQFANPASANELLPAAELYLSLQDSARWILSGLLVSFGLGGFALAWGRLRPDFRARNHVEATIRAALILASTIAILTTIGILFSVLFESLRFFQKISVLDFLFGTVWSPQTALRADQVGSSGAFGMVPLFAGTLMISFIALFVALPIGLMTAIFLSEYASTKLRAAIKPALEILAGIPTVVYGFFAALTVAPMLRAAGAGVGLDVASESALAAGLVMGVMIIPFVSSLTDDVINAVPQALRDASLGLGATQSETIKKVVLPAALPGIVGGGLLAASRAIGETMIVVMAAGLSANLTANPLDAVTTVTVQIVTLLVGDQEFDSAKTLAAFALGLVLFLVTLVMNVAALSVVRRYREQYE